MVGVLVATLFSTGCSNNGTILLHGGGGGEKASISSLKPAKRHEGPLPKGRTPHMKGVEILVGNFELNP